MKTVIRFSALAVAVSANVGVTSAAYHPTSFGKYSTAVAESRLFVGDQVTTLRCDLFFSDAKNNEKLTAPKGSVVSQSVPAFVWQFSGLLPVSDYLKTVAIHSVSSEQKERSWQHVQQTFYNGLRAEGAAESDAKIAYAGAYAFAPRWPLVELIDITVPERDKETRLYKVNYEPANSKGISVADYQSLASDILAAPDQVSLQDIRGVVDAADAAIAQGEKTGVVKSLLGRLFGDKKDKKEVKDPVEDLFIDDAQSSEVESNEVELDKLEQDDAEVTISVIDVGALEEKAVEVLALPEADDQGVIVEIDQSMFDGKSSAPKVKVVQGESKLVWKVMPDGSAVLEQIEAL